MSDTQQTKTEPSAKPRRHWKRWVLPPICMLLFIVGVIYFLTGTGVGLRLAVQVAQGPVSNALEGEFAIEDISGSLWSDVRIGRLVLSLTDGLSVNGRNLRLAWQPTGLLEGGLIVKTVGAEGLSVTLPDQPAAANVDEDEPMSFAIPRLPLRVEIRNLDFPDVSIALPDGSDYRASLLGDVAATDFGEIQTSVVLSATLEDRLVDRISLKAALTPGDLPELTLNLSGEIPSDGVLYAVLDLPSELRRPATVAVSGTGSLAGWSGAVQLDVQGLAELDGTVGLGFAEERIRASFDGNAGFHDPAVFGLPVALAGRYAIAMSELAIADDVLSVPDLSISKDGLAAISLSARMPFDGSEIAAEGKASLAPSAPELFQVPIAYEAVEVAFNASAALPSVVGRVAINAQGLQAFGNTIPEAGIVVEASGALDDVLTVQAFLDGANASWSDASLQQLLGETVAVQAAAIVDGGFQKIDDIAVTVDPVGVSLQTALLVKGQSVIAESMQVNLADLGRLEPVLNLPISGSGVVALSDLRLSEVGTVSTVFEISAKDLSVIDAQVSSLVGRTPIIKGDVLLSETDGLAVTLREARARAGAVSGIVLLSPDFADLSGKLNARAKVSALPPETGLVVQGDLIDVSAQFAGAVAQPDLDATVSAFSGSVSGTELGVQSAAAQLRWRDQAPFVTFQTTISAMGLTATAEGGAAIEPDGLNVPGVSVTGEGWSAWFSASLPDYTVPAKGSAKVIVADASPFSGLAGLASLSGQAEAEAEFRAGTSAGAQSLTVNLVANRIAVAADASSAPVTVERAQAKASIGDVLALRDIDGTISINNIVGNGLNFPEVGLVLQGTGEAIEGDLAIAGADPTPLAVNTHLSGKLLEDGKSELKLSGLNLSYASLERFLTGEVYAALGPGNAMSAALDLKVLSGTLTAGYERSEVGASVSLNAAEIPVGPIADLQGQEGVEGYIGAKADLRHSPDGFATGTFSVSADGLRTEDLDKEISVNIAVDGEIANERVMVRARSAGSGLDRIDIRAGLPVAVSLLEPGAAVNDAGTLEGSVKAEVKLQEVWPYLPLPEHMLAGLFTVDAQLAGTPSRPSLQGEAQLQNVEYEHLVHGTLIRRIQGRVGFAGEDFVVEGLRGEDIYGGNFAIDGNGSLADGAPTFDITTVLSNLRVVNSDAVKADVDAKISARQQADGMLVQGDALIRRAEVNLAVALPPSISILDVEDGTISGPEADEQEPPSKIALDLTVDAPGQIFVRGRGLESEWEGNVRVTGTASKPIVSGGLSARRGRIDVIGKGFTLDQSKIQFFGGETIDPMLGIRGVHEGDDITVIASLEGPASMPEITLASQPPLPQDEVLSRLLFGKTSSSLSPLEAAQLAASASELAGGGSGIDVLGTIRDFVGVDVLEVDTSGDAAAVKAGTYVTDGVFVGAKQGASPGSSSVTVEVEVTPHISVTTESGQTSSNAGVNFKWDY